jgi:hypothetical protein
MPTSLGRDIISHNVRAMALNDTSLTAAGTGDNTLATGLAIDQMAYSMPESIMFVVAATAVLAATKTLTVAMKIQDSDDGSTWADLVTANLGQGSNNSAGSFVLTAVGSATYSGIGTVGVSMEYCRRYVRLAVTPDLNNTATDTARLQAIAVMASMAKL